MITAPVRPRRPFASTNWSILANCLIPLIIGLIWGLVSVTNEHDVNSPSSFVLERIFLICWAWKYYPQIYLNSRRGSTVGLTIDTEYIQALGFISFGVYSAYQVNAFSDPNNVEWSVEVYRVILAINGLICSGLIIFQMYRFHGYRQAVHKGLNKMHNFSGFLVSTYVFFNILYLILIFVKQARGGMVVSRHQYFMAFVYSAAIFLSIHWIPQIRRNILLKSCEGLSLSTVWVELLGSICLLASIILDAFARSQFADSSAQTTPGDLVSVLAQQLLLSSVAGFSISTCLLLLAQAAHYSSFPPIPAPPAAGADIPVPVGASSDPEAPPQALAVIISPTPSPSPQRLSVGTNNPPVLASPVNSTSTTPSDRVVMSSPIPRRVNNSGQNSPPIPATSAHIDFAMPKTGHRQGAASPPPPPPPSYASVSAASEASAPPLTYLADIRPGAPSSSAARAPPRAPPTIPSSSSGARASLGSRAPAADDIDPDTNTLKNQPPPNSK